MKLRSFLIVLGCSLMAGAIAGCTKDSYPGDRLKESIVDICKKEYGIEDVDVRVVASTISVYLPLKKLFTADFKEAALTGKVRNLESLFEPAPEALDKVEDVLFAISRVILSTNRKLQFYSLQATDVEKTGMQLVLSGCVDDIKRVRIWDISREEYRKRIVHELKLNRAARWHQPVRKFFRDLEVSTLQEIHRRYFDNDIPVEAIRKLFLNHLGEDATGKTKPHWKILDIRSLPVRKDQVLVYTEVKPESSGFTASLKYLFTLAVDQNNISIDRIIPFQYQDAQGKLTPMAFPKEFQVGRHLEDWEQEFQAESLFMGPFLAEQLTRRIQAILSQDERIMNTFREVKLSFEYMDKPAPAHFVLTIDSLLSDFNHYSRQSLVFHEDMLYLLNIVSKEFVNLLRSYQFGDYDYLRLNLAQESTPWFISKNSLELFRKNKESLQGLFSMTSL